MSQVKTREEIEYITEACLITDQIFKETISFIKKETKYKNTLSESIVQKYIINIMKQKKLRPSFLPIVSSGTRAGNDIHPKSTNFSLSGFTIIDLGVRYNGYCSDMTRTIYVGTPTDKEILLYNTLLASQQLGIKRSKSGSCAGEIDESVRKFLGIYAQYFIHTLGHGVGKKIHESPILYEKYKKPILKERMVITIEPGLYIPNSLGIRIEDTLVVTNSAPIVLTKTSKKLIVIN